MPAYKNTKAANIKAPHYDAVKVMPTLKDVTEILAAKLSYENAQNTKSEDDFIAWCESLPHFKELCLGEEERSENS